MEPELLPTDHAERIVSRCRDLVGDRLRSITYFTQNDFDQLFLREDLARDADLKSFIGLEWRESGITQEAYRTSELGEHLFTIRAFKNGYLLRVSTDHDGIFITTDGLTVEGSSEVAADLASLLRKLPANQ